MKTNILSPGLLAALAACGALSATPALASCGASFCSVNTEWSALGAATTEGSAFDLRYEYIDQSQPRSGSRRVAVGAIPRHHDEVSTRNHNLIATYSRTYASGWGFSIAAPVVSRRHLHIHNHRGERIEDRWKFEELGDLRVTGRYQLALSGADGPRPSRSGLIFGLKLPTGKTDEANSAGDAAERTLQPGTGTTDAIIGGYFHQELHERGASWFGQAQYQHALNSKDDYRPGRQLSVDVGYGQSLTDRLSLNLQLNAVVKGRDRGAEAEPGDSGGRFLFLSPGLSYSITEGTRAYAFFQQPLYQHVNGVQLTSKRALVVGVTHRF